MLKYYLIKDATVTAIDEPVGFDQFETTLKRSQTKHGFAVEFSEVELTFYCGSGGYDLLLAEYEAEGNDGVMQFRQTYECGATTEILYEGSVNFNSLLHVPGEYITTNLDNVSFSHKLKTREKTKFSMGAEVDLDGNAITPAEPVRLNLHSRAIQKQFDAKDEGDTTTEFTIPKADGSVTHLYAQKGWIETKIDEIEDTYHYATALQESDPVAVNEYLIDVKEAGLYTFDILIYYNLAVTTDVNSFIYDMEFRWILRIDSDEFNLSGEIWVPGEIAPLGEPANYASGDITATITKTVFLNPGQKVYLFAYQDHLHPVDGFPPAAWDVRTFTLTTKATSQINISAETTTGGSLCDVWPVKTVLNQLINGATGLPDRLKSDYFNACGSPYYLGSGFNIRNFPDKPLTLSREEAWAGLNPILALGEGLTIDAGAELVEIEPIEHFYQPSEILSIANPTDYSEEVAAEYIYNSVEIGYEKSNTDEFNALDEFNSKREYQTPIRSFENRLTLNSKFVASMYAVETQRRKPYINASTASATFDNDTFIFATRTETDVKSIAASTENTLTLNGFTYLTAQEFTITGSANNDGTYTVTSQKTVVLSLVPKTRFTFEPDLPAPGETDGLVTASALVAEKDEIFETTANIISPETIYNGRITPLRNLLRWGNVVNSGLWFKDMYTNHLRFVSGEGNVKFQHQFKTSEPCKEGDPDRLLLHENDSLELTQVDRFSKIWKPEYITFKAPLTAEQMQLIRQAHIPQVSAPEKHGYISVWDGEEYQQGYLLELRFKDSTQTQELSSFKLIKKADSGSAAAFDREHGDEYGDEYN